MSEARAARAGRVGSVVSGKWTVDARLGSGGMATVYAATHRNGHRAALKMLHAVLSRDESTRARFLREGYVANAVGHPGVVRVEDDGVSEDGAAFLVLELLEGETIEARRVRLGGTLPLDEVLEVADQALDALAMAHEKGIVHRDVKPDNVFLTRSGAVKLLDFGLARMKHMQAEATRTGVTIGTPEFMAPEQAQGRRDAVDALSDVWAVGATVFTALTGEYVHDASTLHEQLLASATQRPRPVRTVLPGLPEAVAIVVDRALELDKSDRWESAREMQRALRAARSLRRSPMPRAVDSATMPAASPASIRRAGVPESGSRPSLPGGLPSSGKTLEQVLMAPASDPTIEELVPPVSLERLPLSSGPLSPIPHTQRMTDDRRSSSPVRIGDTMHSPRAGAARLADPLAASGSGAHARLSLPHPSLSSPASRLAVAPPPPPPATPTALEQSSRRVVIASVLLILLCAAAGAWVLLHPGLLSSLRP